MNGLYFKEWPQCPDCGLREAGTHTHARCTAVKSGQPLGGKALDIRRSTIDELPEPPPPNFFGEKPPPGTWRDFFEGVTGVSGHGGPSAGLLVVGRCPECGGGHQFAFSDVKEDPRSYICPRTNVEVKR